ncbi:MULTISPECIES: D-2-hydroxyacid dehydrogenase [unclassified Sedimentibacter]|uniref:D-2-hydroxyacid dehydrogenase n=1 Tax=unclassified Sedimentibacter TaxID=2649220 RepID=UPI0027E0DE49|nr:D-2-hydroxyacid dehydrogenase [Sedimentibacter sp. MB35-C1]WMJ76775.1 D-2-hydroxyacid dehydrogenase [Sedimentibacter sp. MB35-C1]
MKIVVLDGYTTNPGDLSWDEIKRIGDADIYDRTPVDLTAERIGSAEIVLTNKSPVSRETIEKCGNIKYIGVLATGYNIVDVDAATENNIVVTNIPSYGTAAVAQFTIALLLEICHHIGEHNRAVMNGDWTASNDWSFWNYRLTELEGKVMGIIGYGRIGQKTGQIAQALGMKILANANHPDPSLENENCKYVDFKTLVRESDVVALHCPLTPSTHGIINKDTIAKMKDGVIIINTSRGPLIVEEDLRDALNSGKVAAAACDVVSAEPIKNDNPLLTAKNIILTPHIAWAPIESRRRLMDLAVKNLSKFIDGNPINVVNRQ